MDEKIQRVDERLTRLIALFILQRKAGTSSFRGGDDYKKQDESLERVNDGLTKVLGLLQNIAGSSSSMKNDDVKKLIKDSLQNKARMLWIPKKGMYNFQQWTKHSKHSSIVHVGMNLEQLPAD